MFTLIFIRGFVNVVTLILKDLNPNRLGLTFAQNRHSDFDGPEELVDSIHTVSSSLHTLILGCRLAHESASPILSLDFPHLTSLTMDQFSVPDTDQAMSFWQRHPSIMKLKLRDTEPESRWFSESTEVGLLPQLKHLEVSVCQPNPMHFVLSYKKK